MQGNIFFLSHVEDESVSYIMLNLSIYSLFDIWYMFDSNFSCFYAFSIIYIFIYLYYNFVHVYYTFS
jgi:hypothetical protein